MIYCPQCGNPNFDDANYCDTCGEPLVNADQYAKMRNAAEMQALLEAQRQQREQAVYNKAYRKAQKDAKKAAKANAKAQAQAAANGNAGFGAGAGAGAGAAGVNGAYGANPNAASQQSGAQYANTSGYTVSGTAPQAAPQPADFPVYRHGCLAQAWDDITETRGWAAIICKLGLVNLVPVLNFFVSGFAMKWASQLAEDRVEPMPPKIFTDGVFLQGFYYFVFTLVCGIVAGFASGILGLIPILGLICGFAIMLFMQMFQTLGIMRIAISQSLGEGFNIKHIWSAIATNQFGKLFCATVLPMLIVSAAIAFVCGSVLIIFGLNSLTTLVDSIGTAIAYQQNPGYGMYDPFGVTDPFGIMSPFGMMDPFGIMSSMVGYDPWAVVFSQAIGMVPLFFVLYLIAAFLQALGIVLTLRATSHYLCRYRRGWCMLTAKRMQR